jgi:hypothetical protein
VLFTVCSSGSNECVAGLKICMYCVTVDNDAFIGWADLKIMRIPLSRVLPINPKAVLIDQIQQHSHGVAKGSKYATVVKHGLTYVARIVSEVSMHSSY